MNEGTWNFLLGLEKNAIDLKKLAAENPRFVLKEVEVQGNPKVIRRILELQDLAAASWKLKKAKKGPARKRGRK